MASFKNFDAVRDTSTTTGTGTITVSGAPPTGFVTFSAKYSVNDLFEYTIRHRTADEWETGIGTYSASNQFTRTAVYESSNSNAAVSFSSGTKDVFTGPIAAASGQHRSMWESIKTVDYTLVTSDVGGTIVANKATAITMNLPTLASMVNAASTAGTNGCFRIRNIGVGDCTIDANGSETIEGALTLVLKTGESAFLWVNSAVNDWRAQVMLPARTSANVLADLGALGKFPFPASQIASAGANDLDDYEEGSWTPAFSATGGIYSYTGQAGTYTKVGRLVFWTFFIQLNTSGNTLGGNVLSVTGLPFAAAFASANFIGHIDWFISTTNLVGMTAQIADGASSMTIRGNTAANTFNVGQLNDNQALHATSGSILYGSGVYSV